MKDYWLAERVWPARTNVLHAYCGQPGYPLHDTRIIIVGMNTRPGWPDLSIVFKMKVEDIRSGKMPVPDWFPHEPSPHLITFAVPEDVSDEDALATIRAQLESTREPLR